MVGISYHLILLLWREIVMSTNSQAVNGQSSKTDAVVAAASPAVQANQPSYAELLAQVNALKAQVAAKAQPIRIVLRKLGEKYEGTGEDKGKMVEGKGNIVVYGLGRYPISQYASQWERLLTPENVATILTLCKDPKASRKE